MKLLKKTIHLNYADVKGDKKIVKSYSFDVKGELEDNSLREIGDEITKLVAKNIDTITVNTKILI